MIQYFSLLVALFSLLIGSAIAVRFKVPSVIIFLLLGAIIGTYNLIGGPNDLITYLGELGSILLLFVIGTEFSINDLIRTGIRNPIIIAALEILISFVILFLIFSIKLAPIPAMLVSLAFSLTSTGITIKLFQELNLRRFDVSLIFKISIIEDIIAVFAFSVVSSYASASVKTPLGLVLSFAISIALFILAYFAFSFLSKKILDTYTINEEELISVVLVVMLLFVYLATALGLSAAFGAYIAGSIVSGWKKRFPDLNTDLRKFSYLFISFFFLTIGLEVNLNTIDFWLLLLILPVVLIVKFVSVYIGTFVATKKYTTSLFTSMGMLSKGELSLVIISSAVSSALLPQSILGLAAFTVFFSALISYIVLLKSELLYNRFQHWISSFR